MATKLERDRKYLEESLRYHKGKWLTKEAVAEYRKRMRNLSVTDMQLIGAKRELCKEFMEEYGITELEATNILNGFNISDYITKYERIRTQTPLIIQKNTIIKTEDTDEDY